MEKNERQRHSKKGKRQTQKRLGRGVETQEIGAETEAPPASPHRENEERPSLLKTDRPRLQLRHNTEARLNFTNAEAFRELQKQLVPLDAERSSPAHEMDQRSRLLFGRPTLDNQTQGRSSGGPQRGLPRRRRRRNEQASLQFSQAEAFGRPKSGLPPSDESRAAPPAGTEFNGHANFRGSGRGRSTGDFDFGGPRKGRSETHSGSSESEGPRAKADSRDQATERPKSHLKFEEDRVPKGKESVNRRTKRDTGIARTIQNETENELRRIADESDNEAVQAANKEREIGFKGLREGGRFGRQWRQGHGERVSQREIKRQNKTLIRETQEKAYELRHGKPSPAAARRKHQMAKRQQHRAAAEQKFGKEAVQKAERIITIVAEKAAAVIRAIVAYVGAPVLGMVLLFALIVMGIMMLFSAMTNNATVVMSSYTASDADIEASSVYMTELEAKLDKEIKDIPTDWRWQHIDEFRYDLDPIEHNPFQLMSYLNVKYPGFQFWQVATEIEYLFDERYELILDEEWEWRGRKPNRYKYYILNVTLTAKPFEPLLLSELRADPTPDLVEWYGVLIETEGARQSYANPFTIDWKDRVTSLYGYRVDPMGGVNLQMHRGLDIAMPGGTPIRAGLSGTVRYVGEDALLGNYIILYDPETERTIKYAHCDSIALDEGDEVVAGETGIGTVGNTGNSTGNHVHIEIQEKGAYLNPIYALTSKVGVTA